MPDIHNVWVGNPVDAFLIARHRALDLPTAPRARSDLLLRRVYLDLVGYPPTRGELQRFRADDSPDPYNQVVDRLLASPQYGERWGRHWMDVWRYSDWAGFGNEIRYSQRHIWRWRDWIIESLNEDKGYDRMILEMLAADELFPTDDDAIRATGFLARNWYKFDRNVWLDDVVEHTGKAFLGMTFKCARCHDHKYDPLAQQEYYALRAVFEPYDVRTDHSPGRLDLTSNGLARIYDAKPDTATYLFDRGDPNRPVKDKPVLPGVPAMINVDFRIQEVRLGLESYYPALRPFVAREMIDVAEAAAKSAAEALTTARETATSTISTDLAEKRLATARARLAAIQSRVLAERVKHHLDNLTDPATLAKNASAAEREAALADADEKLLVANDQLSRAKRNAEANNNDKSKQAVAAAQKKLDQAQKAFAKAKELARKKSKEYRPLGPTYPRTSSGRRSALARWIVNSKNPLTARVAVNHIWLRHFGRPLVEDVDDFGLRSPRPVLVDLLDYLAVELMERDWSMKHLHRLIVTSNAYRSASNSPPEGTKAATTDRDNKLFWRMNLRRMEAETVRDSLLRVAGSLYFGRGGPDIDHRQGMIVPRRSMYFQHARERQMEFLRMFDPANPRECYQRQASIRPQQAFAMVNSSLAVAQSRKLAGRLKHESEPNDFIVAAFETVLSRPPSDAELKACSEFLAAQARRLSEPDELELLSAGANSIPPSTDPRQRARENLVLVLLNHNDFVTIR